MHSFNDSEGRSWDISLNGWQLKTLKKRLNFDARDPESIFQAANDPALLCDVLFVLCQEQATKNNVTDEQFGKAMAGDAIEAAAEAYMLETIDFFPPRQRQALRTMLAKVDEAKAKLSGLAEQKLSGPSMDQMIQTALTEAEKDIDALLAGTSTGNSSGNAPASPDLTHSPERFENSSSLTGGMNTPRGSAPLKFAPSLPK